MILCKDQQYHRAKMGTFEAGRFESRLTFALISCTLDVMSHCHEAPLNKAKSNADELIDHPEATRDASGNPILKSRIKTLIPTNS